MYEKIFSEILYFFPDNIRYKLDEVSSNVWDKAKEIRIRARKTNYNFII